MTRHTVIRPRALSPDDVGLSDPFSMAERRADARNGSAKLLLALLRMDRRRKRPRRVPRPRPYGTTDDRRMARGQVERLQRRIAAHYGISFERLTGPRGPQELSEKRQVAMYLARQIIQVSLPDIATSFHRDHTTVLHACRVVESTPHLAANASELRRVIGA